MRNEEKIIRGLCEALEYAKGNTAHSKESHYNVPDQIDIKALRERLRLSQPEFAMRFGFSLGTLRQWEQGRRFPDGPARVLLTVIESSPETVEAALLKRSQITAKRTTIIEKRKSAVG